jgi:tRNA/tmRNA/rRNA uracil-C5-methylase (TrmA/RlmC/RlmD family)
VVAVESDRRATAYAEDNLAGLAQAAVVRDRVDRWVRRPSTGSGAGDVDLVVLDPPRVGAKRAVVDAVAKMRPRAVAYVACDPAALGRDVGYFAAAGYAVTDLRCLDLFPMTHHVECVALLTKSGSDLR